MNSHTSKTQPSSAKHSPQKNSPASVGSASSPHLETEFQVSERQSPQNQQAAQLQLIANTFVSNSQAPFQNYKMSGADGKVNSAPSPKTESKSNLPEGLKAGIKQLSGESMEDVKVHYNSKQPAQLHAHAYAQGNDIHIASGQEKHLAHEAWHVVQQKQGRVPVTRQLKGKVNINDDIGLEREADMMGAKAERQGNQLPLEQHPVQGKGMQQLSGHAPPVQRVQIPGSQFNTATLTPDKTKLQHLSILALMKLWGSVNHEKAKNAMQWRLEISGAILIRLSKKAYGDYDRDLLQPLSAKEVEAGLARKKGIGSGSMKKVANVPIKGKEIVTATVKSQKQESDLKEELSMLQFLQLLGVRVPTLYGTKKSKNASPDLHRGKDNKLNLLMGKVAPATGPLLVYEMGKGVLTEKLTAFLQNSHKNDLVTFAVKRANMLMDLRKLLEVAKVLTICDLELLIENPTGHLYTIDPGAIVPAGSAGDRTKESDTLYNLSHAVENLSSLLFKPFTQNDYTLSVTQAEYIGDFCARNGHSKYEDLLFRINKEFKGKTITKLSDCTLTAKEVKAVIETNKDKSDLGDLVEPSDIETALKYLADAKG